MNHFVKKDIIKLFIFYFIAHGWVIFLYDALYWDDWTLFNAEDGDIFRMFELAGSPFNLTGYLHVFLLKGGPLLYKLLVFSLNLFTGLLLYMIIKDSRRFDDRVPYYFTLMFLISPLFIARIAMITLPYSLCLFLFTLAWYFYHKNKTLSLIAFFLSFNIPSFLVFYSIPILYFIYQSKGKFERSSILHWTKRNLHFVSLPFIYFGIHKFLFTPSSFYEGYNRGFDVSLLWTSLKGIATDALQLNLNLILISSILIGAVYYFNKSKNEINRMNAKHISFYVILLALVLAWFPYGILGYSPQFFDWNSRHQLLLMFPISFLFLNVFLWIKKYRIIILSFVVSISMYINIGNYIDLLLDWNKQKQIVALLASTDKIEKGAVVIFSDQTKEINALSRTYRFYEWNGIMKYTYGDESRFGINNDEYVNEYFEGVLDQYFDPLYAAGGHQRSREIVNVEIQSNGLKYFLLVNGEQVDGNYRLRDSFRSLEGIASLTKLNTKVSL